MKPDNSRIYSHDHLMVGYAKVGEVVATVFFTSLVFGFYMAHYAWSTGFFTSAFTPPMALLFFASVLWVIVNTSAKVMTPRKDVVALVELAGALLFVAVAAWIFIAFPLNFAHVGDVVPAQLQFTISWLTNDMGRILVPLILLAGIIAFMVDSAKLGWEIFKRQFRKIREPATGM